MYSEKESAGIREKFWTALGQYLAPIPSAAGVRINWINYKTGIKGITFTSHADNNTACVAVEIFNNNTMLQHHYFDLFHKFAPEIGGINLSEWKYEKEYLKYTGKTISFISAELKAVNLYNEAEWPEIISFIKKQLMALDLFWNEYKPEFE